MKKILILLAIGSITVSCQKSWTSSDLDHLYGVILEVEDREGVSSGGSNIFGFYTNGVRFNSDGTLELLDDDYGLSDSWLLHQWTPSWWVVDNSIMINFREDGSTEWEIQYIRSDQLKVKETNTRDTGTVHILKISSKQEIR